MSSTRHPPAYCLETMEDTPKGNGVVRDSRFRRFNLCQTRNLAILFLFVIVLIIAAVLSAGTDVFESRDVSLPATNNGKGGDELVDSLNNGGNDDGDKGDNADDIDDMINKVNLDSFNPKRDGVDFISPICNYTCQTDRLPHETPLYPGQVLCNEMHRFGMTEEGEFFLQNCQLTDQNDGKLTVFWSAKEAQLAPDQYPIHFEMEKNGYFQIISDPSGQVLFEKRPTRNVTFHRLCLNNRPKLHCPYLHLHNDAVVVLNWIDDVQGRWMARNVKHEYVELFPEDIGDEGADDNAGADDTTNDEDDVDDMINKVHLDAFNPKRDGVEFISPICNYTCQTDRLPHETPLYPGQVLCNQMHRFGMTDQGEFFVQNCQLTDQNDGKLTVFWSAAEAQLTPDQYPIHFEMEKNGYFQIISDPSGQVLFEKRPTRNVTFHRLCLNNRPKLHCPYLHLRETGMVVLNWIDDVQGKWMARDMKQQYLGLFPNVDNKDRFL